MMDAAELKEVIKLKEHTIKVLRRKIKAQIKALRYEPSR